MDEKIFEREVLKEKVQALKRAGKKRASTTGCA